MLVHHADAGLERGAAASRAAAARSAPSGPATRSALVGDVVAEEDVHQRRLAGAVLAEERQDLAPVQRQVDGVVGDERAEALRHALPGRE